MAERIGRRLTLAGIAAAVLLGPIGAPGEPAWAAGTLDRILQERALNIGYIPAPPGQFKDLKTGEIKGYYADAARFIAETMGVRANFVETKWATFAAGLQSGQFDICIGGTFATIPRATAVEFTKPIHYLAFAAAARKGSPMAQLKAVSEANRPEVTVAVVQGSAGHDFVKAHLKKAKVVALATADLTAPFVEVSAGRADIAIQDVWQVERYTRTHPEVVPLFVDRPFNRLPISWSVRRGDHEFLNFINTAIDYLLVNQKMEEFVRAYGGSSGRFQMRLVLEPADGSE